MPAGFLSALLLLLSAAVSSAPAQQRLPNAPGWTLVGWSDRGIHWMDGDYSVFALAPPFNTIHAQLIGPPGRLIRDGARYSVTYEAVRDPGGSMNSFSTGKTNFWQFARSLFGAAPAAETGLAGSRMPGAGNSAQPMRWDASRNRFTAEGIPLTPYDDTGNRNEYPMMRLTARDDAGAVLATTDVALPVSDELGRRTCHATGARPETRPAIGYAGDPAATRDFKINILRLHDQLEFRDPLFVSSLAAAGYSPDGLAETAAGGRPVLCAACHPSSAPGLPPTGGQPGVSPLTRAMHGFHARVTDLSTGLRLDFLPDGQGCLQCHPGPEGRFPRGAMAAAVAADGALAMTCQDCHGSMTVVGGERRGWVEQPNCQACHTGTAIRNSGQIRYTTAFDGAGLRVAADPSFATSPNTPEAGLSLYPFSAGHGGLQCAACHGTAHAEYPSSHDNDNVQNIALQGHKGVLAECRVCHTTAPRGVTGGPHGLHPTGETWVDDHEDAAEDNPAPCRACHGADYRGTVLSRTTASRTLSAFGTKQLWRGYQVGCFLCHNGPSSEDANPVAPAVASAAQAAASPGSTVRIPLTAAGAGTLNLRIVAQPLNGRVSLEGATATYRPRQGWEGADPFTFAAWNGSADSNLATVTVNVAATARPGFAAGGVVNAASYRPGGIAPGEIVAIFGSRLGPSQLRLLELNSAGWIARSLAGTRVLFDGVPAPLVYTSEAQLGAIVPYAIAGKAFVLVQVEYQGIRSTPVNLAVLEAIPGVFTLDSSGSGRAAAINQDGSLNGPDRPAEKNSAIAVFATGEGRLDRFVFDGQVAAGADFAPALAVTARIGGLDAPVEYRGAAPGLAAGVMQVNVRIPAAAASGPAVPLELTVGSASTRQSVGLAIR